MLGGVVGIHVCSVARVAPFAAGLQAPWRPHGINEESSGRASSQTGPAARSAPS